MAVDFVQITANTPQANNLRRYINNLQQAYTQGVQTAAILNNMAADPDYSMIESVFGLATGQGVTLYNLVVAANGQVNNSNVTGLLNQVG
jgi:hypothetical protein